MPDALFLRKFRAAFTDILHYRGRESLCTNDFQERFFWRKIKIDFSNGL